MAKRFIETGLLRKPLLRGLQGAYKTLFVYYITECDHAGIWNKADLDIAGLLLGETFTVDDVESNFGNSIVDLGDKWFMPSFIEFQYGELNESNRAHNSVIKILSKNKICPLKLKIKPLTSPLQGAKDMDKDIVKDKDMDKDKINEQDFINYCKEFVPPLHPDWTVDQIERCAIGNFRTYEDQGWKDGNGKKIKNWKTTIRNKWKYEKPWSYGNAGKANTSAQNPNQYR
jgi:hypothetical protein